MKKKIKLSYSNSGVNLSKTNKFIKHIKVLSKNTIRKEVIKGIGCFSSLCKIPKNYNEPVIVSSTDGVGTKINLAIELNKHNSIGLDLVAMNLNDIIVQGAEPLFFLNSFSCGKFLLDKALSVLKGIIEGCRESNCSLIGGETAEMPGMYNNLKYDLTGFAIGIVEKSYIMNYENITEGDILLGLNSSGAHSNGYSLIRKLIKTENLDINKKLSGKKLSEIIMKPTKIYVKQILRVIKNNRINIIKGLVNITGGGLIENLPRVIPLNLCANIYSINWKMQKLFNLIQFRGKLSNKEMYRVFNCSIGMVVISSIQNSLILKKNLELNGNKVYFLGNVKKRIKNEGNVLII